MSSTARAGLPLVATVSRPRSPAAEAYRTLRTNLQPAGIDGAQNPPRRRLLLTSAGPDEGKSTVVANLAVAMAQAGSKVVVVDADLRRPGQHTLFQLRDSPGLSNLLLSPGRQSGEAGNAPLQATTVEGLWLLPSGPLPPNPADLLGSQRMGEVLDGLAGQADVLVLDSPPVVPFADAAVLSRWMDGVLLVVGAGTVKRDLARKARAQLDAVKANVLGVVVVNLDYDATPFAPYYESEGAAPGGAAPSMR